MITNARMIIKRGNGKPTVPASNDNNDGTWIATDIYEGEQYLDLNTNVIYTRSGNNIVVLSGGNIGEMYKAEVTRVFSSTGNTPTVAETVNTLGVCTWTYDNITGIYTGTFTDGIPTTTPNAQISMGVVVGYPVIAHIEPNVSGGYIDCSFYDITGTEYLGDIQFFVSLEFGV
jgi:hypothetical protein